MSRAPEGVFSVPPPTEHGGAGTHTFGSELTAMPLTHLCDAQRKEPGSVASDTIHFTASMVPAMRFTGLCYLADDPALDAESLDASPRSFGPVKSTAFAVTSDVATAAAMGILLHVSAPSPVYP